MGVNSVSGSSGTGFMDGGGATMVGGSAGAGVTITPGVGMTGVVPMTMGCPTSTTSPGEYETFIAQGSHSLSWRWQIRQASPRTAPQPTALAMIGTNKAIRSRRRFLFTGISSKKLKRAYH
jgi:hypothetical protein